VEFLIGNVPVAAAGPMLLGSHILIFYLWSGAAVVSTCLSHSGYQLPFLGGNQDHDYHHSTAADNLGVTGVLDALYKTNVHYLTSWQYKVNKSYSTADYPIDKIIESQPTDPECCTTSEQD
jgi:methylsterol monooxygenase